MHDLGVVVPATMDKAVDQAVEVRNRELKAKAKLVRERMGSAGDGSLDDDALERMQQRYGGILTYDEFLDVLKSYRVYHNLISRNDPDRWQPSPPMVFLMRLTQDDKFSPDRSGYGKYLQRVAPELWDVLQTRISANLTDEARKRHTYCTGASGSGKSQLLVLLAHAYVNSNCAVVVIDPHGDFARQIAQWKEWEGSDRLVMIDPVLHDDMTPVLNPFDIKDRSPKNIEVMTQQLMEMFGEMLGEQVGGGFTVRMQAMLEPCIKALLCRKGSTLYDLWRFMDDGDNHELVRHAITDLRKIDPHGFEAEFFEREFSEKNLNQSKGAVRLKIQRMLRASYSLFVGDSTVNLDDLLNKRKFICFSLAKGEMGADASEAFGRFVVASIQGFGMRQAAIDPARRVPVHLFIDECQNYLGGTASGGRGSIELILTEARKYGIHLTLAQQYAGQGMGVALVQAVLGNTNVKLTGFNDNYRTYERIAKSTGIERQELDRLGRYEWMVRWGSGEPSFVLKSSDRLVDDNNRMSDAAWSAVVADQLKRYYRKKAADTAPLGEGENSATETPTDKPAKADNAAPWSLPFDE